MSFHLPDAIVALLLFLLGAQTLILQAASSDIKHVIMRDKKRFFGDTGIPVIVGIILIAIYHAFLWLGITEKDLAESLLVAGFIILAGFSLYFSISFTKKEDVIERIKKRALREMKKDGKPPAGYLEDIQVLGLASKPGEEKNWALKSLGGVAEAALRHPLYQGNGLGEWIDTLRMILLEGEMESSPDNYRVAAELLEKILGRYHELKNQGSIISDGDLSIVCEVLALLGEQAVKFSIGGVAINCIDILSNSSDKSNPAFSQGLREIGCAAIDYGRFVVAMDAFHVLDSMVFEGDSIPAGGEVIYDYLGLLGYFWCHGASGRNLAGKCLDYLDLTPGADLPDLINQAIDHHRWLSRFTVADRIDQMWQEHQQV